MESADKFKMMMAGLSELYGKEVSGTLAEIYWKALSDYSDEQVIAAVDNGIKKWTCFGRIPTPGEIIAEIDGQGSDAGLVAWELLTEAVRYHGAGATVQFTDTRITRVVEAMGGWVAVCNWNMAEIHFRRNEFLKFYQSVKPLSQTRALPGLVQLDNTARGYLENIPKPVVIGDDRKHLRLVEYKRTDEAGLTDETICGVE